MARARIAAEIESWFSFRMVSMRTHESIAGTKSASGILKEIQLNQRSGANPATESLDNLLIRLLNLDASEIDREPFMPMPANTGDKDRAYRRRLAARGRRQLIVDLPEELIAAIDELKQRQSLRSRSQVLVKLIERGREAIQQIA